MNTALFSILKPLLYRLDPEDAHKAALCALKSGLVPCGPHQADDARLSQTLWGRTFPNPVGLAAGFDKNAEVIAPMLRAGFGFVEVGTVTPEPQDGNPRPRVFRDVQNKAVINRMGFPNKGAEAFRHNIERFLEKRSSHKAGPVGINIGMNKGQENPAADYTALVRLLGPYADYLTVNISSPNTPGLRNLQERAHLLPLLQDILAQRTQSCGGANPPPLFVKLAPDLSETQQEEIAATALESGIDGLILTNTTLERPDYLPEDFRDQTGGLSGAPLTRKSTAIIRNFYRLTQGKMPIIGAGGIANARDAYDKIRAGACLVQLYSALVFEGPMLAHTINRDLVKLLEKDGLHTIGEAVGVDA